MDVPSRIPECDVETSYITLPVKVNFARRRFTSFHLLGLRHAINEI
jgi:hypothetical protein